MSKNRTIRSTTEGNRAVILLLYCVTAFAFVVIVVLLTTIINNSFGFVVLQDTIPLEKLYPGTTDIKQLSATEMRAALHMHLSRGLIRRLESEKPLSRRSEADLRELVVTRVIEERITQSYSLFESLFHRDTIAAFAEKQEEQVRVVFRSWLRFSLLQNPQSPKVELAGIRTAIFGSLWMLTICAALAFPIGVAAAIYLEEYARENWFNRLIRINIYNLAGIPSIIYGILGLAIFVRVLEPITSGRIFGLSSDAAANGRTIISAGATLSLLILPIIIISAQEALRGTPQSIRDSSYGLGATKWQTVLHHVLPYSIDRIITGAILALSRAIGETAPLIVIGAATFVTVDPKNIFSKFTTLPIQIYQWAARPQDEYRHLAAAAIIILLIMLLSMNLFAIILRNHYSKKRRLMS